MKAVKRIFNKLINAGADERGSALIIVTLLLALLTVYVSASLTISTTDVIASNFEVAQKRGFYTAYSKLEQMSRDFSTLFISSLSPGTDSMCRVVVADPTLLNGFRIVKPDVTCPAGAPCAPAYTGKFVGGTDLYDLGWVGDTFDPVTRQPRPFCIVDVCNPNAAPLCNFPLRPPTTVQIDKGDFAGLQGFARRYRMVATAVSENRGGADVQITRDFDNILLPLFQFGIFTDSDFELYIPPNWAFGGWAHTNGDFYVSGGNGIGSNPRNSFSQYVFDRSGNLVRTAARITAAKHVVIGNEKSGDAVANSYMRVFRDATNFDDINAGSALTGPLVNNCNGIVDPTNEAQTGTCGSFRGTSSGTVKIGVRKLQLPIQNVLGASPIELIKRGLASDLDPSKGSPFVSARYFYKPGLRITVADYQNQLPRTVKMGDSPTQGTGDHGGVQLDGPDAVLANAVGTGPGLVATGTLGAPLWFYQQDGIDTTTGAFKPIPRGYQPKVMNPNTGQPRAVGARVNGNRVHGWIKIEVVKADGRTFDITQEILNLGVTVPYTANKGVAYYFPRGTADFPNSELPLAVSSTGPYPDENSIIHLQRFAVPYTNATVSGLGAPADLTRATLAPGLDDVSANVNFDYYASAALRNYNNNTLKMYGIKDEPEPGGPVGRFMTRKDSATTNNYAEPQPDRGGYYTDIARAPLPTNALQESQIDFSGATNMTRTPPTASTAYLAENVNLPKNKSNTDRKNLVLNQPAVMGDITGETTWFINGAPLIPFPINMYDSREGLPHESNTFASADPPLPGMTASSVTKNGTMNLFEIDMGNLGRLLRGDFDEMFKQMGSTPFTAAMSRPLRASDLRDNIDVLQDNGWLVYINDRRGDEPILNTNPNIKMPMTAATMPVIGMPSTLGDGEYNRENVLWNNGGSTTSGNEDFVAVKTGGMSGCTAGTLASDNKDTGKSPQDSNNDCFIMQETAGNFSETSPYNTIFNTDQSDTTLTFNDLTGTPARLGNIIAMTQVPTNNKPAWSRKPAVSVQPNQRIEMFRRAVRLVNASNLFPTGPERSVCGALYGVTVATENPVYVFGNYNAPAAEVGDVDEFPGLSVNPSITSPTSPAVYNGQNLGRCGNNCHVPAAIVADAISMLSGPNVGTTNTDWSGANGFAGWMDARSFTSPYQALGFRSARNTVYRFALISGFTPSWFPGFWGNNNANQGGGAAGSQYSSGALNNFPRFLEDWGQNGTENQFVTYAGSLIRIYKSRQANGAFKRVSTASVAPGQVDYVYRPPNRDWIFDLDFNNPCTLPPGSPFLQLIDFKGFQQSVVQR